MINRNPLNNLKKVFSIVLFLFVAFFSTGTSFAATWPVPSAEIQSEAGVLLDADSDTVLYQKNATTAYFPASITKVMTAIIVLENAKNLDDSVTFSYAATNTNLEENSTVIGAVAGDTLSVRDCLYCLLLHSANDCANALAEYVAGSNEKFAELMNEKATELGCVNTHFMNPSGLNDPDHYTCAIDMAKILQYAIKNPTFCRIDEAQVYTHAPISKYPDPSAPENTVYAHHRMLRRSYSEYYEGAFAGKTGYTMTAGNTLVTACRRDGMTLIGVVLESHNTQYADTKAMFDFGYASFTSTPVQDTDPTLSSLSSNLRVDGVQMVDALVLSTDPDRHITLPKDTDFSEVSGVLTYDLSDAEKASHAIARMDYTLAGYPVGNALILLTDPSQETNLTALDANTVKSLQAETVPETIDVAEGSMEATVSGQLPMESTENHAPIYYDEESGKIRVQQPVINVLVIMIGIGVVFSVVAIVLFLFEQRAEYLRKRRRRRILRHTSELSREQKIRRDLLLNSRSSKRRKKRY